MMMITKMAVMMVIAMMMIVDVLQRKQKKAQIKPLLLNSCVHLRATQDVANPEARQSLRYLEMLLDQRDARRNNHGLAVAATFN